MAYDEPLAARVRSLVADLPGGVTEQPMFGGLGFVLDSGHMAVCVSGQGGLLVRVPAGDAAGLCERDDVEPMQMGGRASRTWVHVQHPALVGSTELADWVERGLAVARSLPPKSRP